MSKWQKFVVGSGFAISGIIGFGLFKDHNTFFLKYKCTDDLSGKTYLVTGATSGIGMATADKLVRQNARVVMAVRDMAECQKIRREMVLRTKNRHVVCRECDLASLNSIRKLAVNVLAREKRLDGIVNCAGVMRCPRTLTAEGIEYHFGVNFLGHFLLNQLLMDMLKQSAPSRIVSLVSTAHLEGHLEFDNLNMDDLPDDTRNKSLAYYNAELSKMLYTKEFSRRYSSAEIAAIAVYPRQTNSKLTRFITDKWYSLLVKPVLYLTGQNCFKAAEHVAQALCSPEMQEKSGSFLDKFAVRDTSLEGNSPKIANRLWLTAEKWSRLADQKALLELELVGEMKKVAEERAKRDLEKSQSLES